MIDALTLTRNKAEMDSIQATLDEARARLKTLEEEGKKWEDRIEVVANEFVKAGGVDLEIFKEFLRQPYLIIPKSQTEIHVVVPKFVNFQVGWLLRETDSFKIFVFNQYSAWFGETNPEFLSLIGATDEFKGTLVEGETIYFDEKYRDKVIKKLKEHLKAPKATSATIIHGHEFDVIAEIVKAGALPFRPHPVDKQDLRAGITKIVLRDYQQEAYKKFMETGAIGIYLPTGAGKSLISLRIADEIKGKKLIIVPTITLRDQWREYIRDFIGTYRDEYTVETYQARHIMDREWSLVIYDESQKLPANTFSRLALIKTKYRIGLSASPFREDGRENYIIALTGFPVGIDWNKYMASVGRKFHPVTVHVVGDLGNKMTILKTLLNKTKRTLVFCDTIEYGKNISTVLGIPHIYGDTKDRLDIIRKNWCVVISRVGDLGISIKDLDHIIEVDFLFGSRSQEIQRTGRLMHSNSAEPCHDIIMTKDELARYGKRLYGLQEKGFRIEVKNYVPEVKRNR